MSHPQLLLSNQLCFLFYRVDRAIAARYRPLLGPLGLTYPQYLVMLVLWELGECPVGELCRRLHLDTGTVSPLLKRLAAAGNLTRERSADDERSVRISLTEGGRALEERAKDIPSRMGSCIIADEAEYLTLMRDMGRLAERLERENACG